MNDHIERISQRALKLGELNKQAIKAILNHKIEDFCDLAKQFIELKKDLTYDLSDYGTFPTEDIQSVKVINKLCTKDKFETENIWDELLRLSGIDKGDESSIDVIDEAEQWFHGSYDVVKIFIRKMAFGPIASKVTKPQLLNKYFIEAFDCFAFGNFNAMYSLCRTILETVMRDICKEKKLLKRIRDWNDIPASILKSTVTTRGNKLYEELDYAYGRASRVIHGKKAVNEGDAKDLFEDTLRIVRELYDLHAML